MSARIVRRGGMAGQGGAGAGPAGGVEGAQLKPLGSPRGARVILDDGGQPVAITAGRRSARPKRVAAVRERWRIDDEWWREPLAREYLAVVLEDGRPLTLYFDCVEGGWWVQGEEG